MKIPASRLKDLWHFAKIRTARKAEYAEIAVGDFIGLLEEADRVAGLEAKLEKLKYATRQLLDSTEPPPEPKCNCMNNPPCSDCVDFGGLREAIQFCEELLKDDKKLGTPPEGSVWVYGTGVLTGVRFDMNGDFERGFVENGEWAMERAGNVLLCKTPSTGYVMNIAPIPAEGMMGVKIPLEFAKSIDQVLSWSEGKPKQPMTRPLIDLKVTGHLSTEEIYYLGVSSSIEQVGGGRVV